MPRASTGPKADLGDRAGRRPERHVILIALLLVGLCALAVAWQWTPLRQWVDLARFLAWLEGLGHGPVAVVVTLAAYPLSALIMLPSLLLILGTLAVFGPLAGSVYATFGCLLSAMLSYALGRLLGWQHLGRLQRRLDQVARFLSGREVLTVALINLSMISNLALVGLAAGVLRLRFAPYLLGTLIGVVPGIVVLALFEEWLEKAIRDPSPANVAMLVVFAIIATLAALWAIRNLGRRAREKGVDARLPPDADSPAAP